MSNQPKTLFEKVWERHLVAEPEGEPSLLYIDLQLVHEVTSPQAFEGLRIAGRTVRCPQRTVATVDHNIPTTIEARLNIVDPIASTQIKTLRANCAEFGIELFDVDSPDQGVVHVVGPELGLTKPGMTIVCGDSHTSTHGAFGAPRPCPRPRPRASASPWKANCPPASRPRTLFWPSSAGSAPTAPPATSSSTPDRPFARSPWKAA
jgi:hypothetical protein